MYEYAGAGEEGFFPTVVPIACPVGMFWDEHARRCAPIVMSPPPPIVPILAGYYAGAPVGEWHDIEPNLFGVDAALKGCGPGMYWDGYFKRCAKVSVPLGPAPAPPIVPILAGYYAGAPVGEWHDIEPNLFGVD